MLFPGNPKVKVPEAFFTAFFSWRDAAIPDDLLFDIVFLHSFCSMKLLVLQQTLYPRLSDNTDKVSQLYSSLPNVYQLI